MQFSSFFSYPDSNLSEQADELVFWQNHSDEDWETLLKYTETLYLHIGDVVINQGETDRGLYFVVNGQLEVLSQTRDSQHWQRLATLEASSVFGEQAFFDGKPRSAAVRAISDGTLLRLSPEAFEVLAAQQPALARDILFDLGRILSLRLRQSSTMN